MVRLHCRPCVQSSNVRSKQTTRAHVVFRLIAWQMAWRMNCSQNAIGKSYCLSAKLLAKWWQTFPIYASIRRAAIPFFHFSEWMHCHECYLARTNLFKQQKLHLNMCLRWDDDDDNDKGCLFFCHYPRQLIHSLSQTVGVFMNFVFE